MGDLVLPLLEPRLLARQQSVAKLIEVDTPDVVAVFTKWGNRMKNTVRKFDASNEHGPMD